MLIKFNILKAKAELKTINQIKATKNKQKKSTTNHHLKSTIKSTKILKSRNPKPKYLNPNPKFQKLHQKIIKFPKQKA